MPGILFAQERDEPDLREDIILDCETDLFDDFLPSFTTTKITVTDGREMPVYVPITETGNFTTGYSKENTKSTIAKTTTSSIIIITTNKEKQTPLEKQIKKKTLLPIYFKALFTLASLLICYMHDRNTFV
ncbi:MAG: hypothetical protein LBI53_04030 [Candidatus Peribacteria bacterium]|jgi:hypothetical protein|nr:hypothetical protein [Candidatus Peribacteria bacterium]